MIDKTPSIPYNPEPENGDPLMLYSLNIEANSPLELADAVAGLLNITGNVQLVTAVQRSRIAEAQKARAAGQPAEATTDGPVAQAEPQSSGDAGSSPAGATTDQPVAAEPVVPPKQPRARKKPDVPTIEAIANPNPAVSAQDPVVGEVRAALTQSVADPAATPPLDRETVRQAIIALGKEAQKHAAKDVSATDAMRNALTKVFDEMVPPITTHLMKDVPDDRLGELNALVAKHHAALTA